MKRQAARLRGFFKAGLPLLAVAGLASCDRPKQASMAWVPAPGASGIFLARTETTNQEWLEYVRDQNPAWPGSPEFTRSERGAWRLRPGRADHPVTHVSLDDARAYCAWRSRREGKSYRLPTSREWIAAARAGLEGVRFPWGWEPPEGRANFDASGPAPTARHPANRLGLHDLAGNVWEWCDDPGGAPMARGGAWSERDPRLLECDAHRPFPLHYRDADLGFRVAREPAPGNYSGAPIQKVPLK